MDAKVVEILVESSILFSLLFLGIAHPQTVSKENVCLFPVCALGGRPAEADDTGWHTGTGKPVERS